MGYYRSGQAATLTTTSTGDSLMLLLPVHNHALRGMAQEHALMHAVQPHVHLYTSGPAVMKLVDVTQCTLQSSGSSHKDDLMQDDSLLAAR
jgi:hypothetical protein